MGHGNYGIDDFIDPGTPAEYFQFEINGGAIQFIGNNDADNVNDTAINTWQPTSNRVVVQTGSEAEGFVVIQYLTLVGEPVIRMKMSYTNTTGSAVTLRAARGTDPDQDSFSHGSSSTDNLRGLGSIPVTEISYALGPISGKAIAIYCPGNGYTHNTAILGHGANGGEGVLYTYDINRILNNVDDLGDPVPDNIPNSDIGIACAWDVGTVNAGATVDLYCYYVLGNHIENIASRLGSRSTTSLTISLADITSPDIFSGLGVYLGSGSWNINVPFTGNYDGSIADAIEFDFASPGVLAQWEAAWASAGYDTNYSYAWNATWASGQTGVVRMNLIPAAPTGQQIFIVPIDTTFPAWQTTTPNQVPAVQGVFTLPVTLTPYVPATQMGLAGSWC